jgi:hypothetical protein
MPLQLAIPQVTFKKSDLDDPNLTLLNQTLQNITAALDSLIGSGGTTTVKSHLNLSGNTIQNLGDPSNPGDAVSKAYADANYGPATIRQALEILGKNVLQSMRRLNDVNQRETSSSFLNNLMSTAPTTNTSTVNFGSPSGGTVPVTISSGVHQKVDRSIVAYSAFNDTLTLPTSYTISTIVRSGNIVTVTTTGVNSIIPGENAVVGGVADSSFDGSFQVLNIHSSTVFTYQQFAPNGSSSGGSVSLSGTYYYSLQKNSGQLVRTGPFSADSQSNRLIANFDSQTLIAVVIINGSGGDNTNSSAGATPPVTGSNVRILARL